MSEWISVNEKLPNDLQQVLTIDRRGHFELAVYKSQGQKCVKTYRYFPAFVIDKDYDCKPTHWQPLPSPPENVE